MRKAEERTAETANGSLNRQVEGTAAEELGRSGLVVSGLDSCRPRRPETSFWIARTRRVRRKRRLIREESARCGHGERKTKESSSAAGAGGEQVRVVIGDMLTTAAGSSGSWRR